MAKRKYRPDPDIRRSIVAFIAAGAFPQMAAEAVGIPGKVFDQWLERGDPMDRKRGWKPHPVLTPFWHAVMEARARARVGAEIDARREHAIRWLMQGPGKDRPDTPGWSQMVRATSGSAADSDPERESNPLLDPGMQDLFKSMIEILAPFPEARAALARGLAARHGPAQADRPPLPHPAPQDGV